MNLRRDFIKIPLAAALAGALTLAALPSTAQQPVTLLNVSYDPTRELYVEFNQAFAKHWKGEKEFGSKVDVVYPSLSILAEPPVTVVDRNVDRKGTRAVAEEYLKFLYTEEGQDIAGKTFYRPAISQKAGLRRMGQSGQGALRRRRQLRSDLHAQISEKHCAFPLNSCHT